MQTVSSAEFNALKEKEKHTELLNGLLSKNKAAEKRVWMKRVVKVHKKKKSKVNQGFSKIDWKGLAVAKRRV